MPPNSAPVPQVDPGAPATLTLPVTRIGARAGTGADTIAVEMPVSIVYGAVLTP